MRAELPPLPPLPPPPTAAAGEVEALREDLAATGYTVDGVTDFLGEQAAAALHREETLPARRRIAREPGPVATVVALFTLGDPVEASAVEAAFPRTGVAGLGRLGLLRAPWSGGSSRVAATCDLRPYGDEGHSWWVASDFGELARPGPLHPDHVLGVGGASATLASWTPRRRVARALDLGTGCGVQSLHLSGHCGHVVATDTSARALAFAAFNAQLAQADWEPRAGDLWDPVAGERFDLIVSNPPFVITPRRDDVPRYTYRDGGAHGDDLVRALVRGAADHLAPGGVAQFLGNWEVPAGGDWREVLDRWLDGTGLDALVVQREVSDPCQYAEMWARDGGHRPGTLAYEQLYAAWLDDFEARGVEAVGFGVLTLSRPDGSGDLGGSTGSGGSGDSRSPDASRSIGCRERAPRVELVDHPGPVATPMGPWIDAALQARRELAASGPAGILTTRWVVADDVSLHTYGRPGQGDPSVIQLTQGGGLRANRRLDQVLAAFASVCDGELTGRAALHAIAAVLGRDAGEVIDEALPGIEVLIADGFLRPWQAGATG